jgi:predicted nucleotide-binding protein (sugar kinase/HSP70/actin superfamily)
MWRTFFEELGYEVVVSPHTDRALVEEGAARSVDECCLASKTFLGHVDALRGRCDALFVPAYLNGNAHAGFCTKFHAAPDLVAHAFRDEEMPVLITLAVEDVSNRRDTRAAWVMMARRLGVSAKDAHKAFDKAFHAQREFDEGKARSQAEALAAASSASSPLSILVVGHPYITHDDYLCGAVVDALKAAGVTTLFADETNHATTYKASFEFSETMPWCISRELVGSILTLRNQVDGIILLSAFPCGPDSMTDDAIMRCIQGVPILNLMIDAQSGTAGVETRIESFVDILQFQHKGGYGNA